MTDIDNRILDPPMPPPKAQPQYKTRYPVKDEKGEQKRDENGELMWGALISNRKLVKGRIRTSSFAYVSPRRAKAYKHQWRVRYNRRGVKFDRHFKSRLLCAWIARELHAKADPDLFERFGYVIDSEFFLSSASDIFTGLIWIHGTKKPTIVELTHYGCEINKDVPWFYVKGQRDFVSPEITVNEDRSVTLEWRYLGDNLYAGPGDCLEMATKPWVNAAGQIVMNRKPEAMRPKAGKKIIN